MTHKKIALVVSAVLLLFAFSLRAVELNVFAAASLTDAMKKIAPAYEKKSGDRIYFNFGASSMLARQIEAGAQVDIFFSADEAKMDALEKQGLIRKETRVSRLSNSLVIVTAVNGGITLHRPDDLTNAAIKRIALADPKAVPAGIYARQFLEKQNLWTVLEPRIIPTDNVRAALAAVESGDVEAGIVFKTDAGISSKVRVAYAVAPADGPKISYPMAVLAESKQVEAAKKFLHYLNSDDAAKVFAQYGFVVLP
jgi:molybdate transport system substrate-binding protein